MGKKKLRRILIKDKKRRGITFSKRYKGLLKKGDELSVLTGCEVFIMIKKKSGTKGERIIKFCSNDDVNCFLKRNKSILYKKPNISFKDANKYYKIDSDLSSYKFKETKISYKDKIIKCFLKRNKSILCKKPNIFFKDTNEYNIDSDLSKFEENKISYKDKIVNFFNGIKLKIKNILKIFY